MADTPDMLKKIKSLFVVEEAEVTTPPQPGTAGTQEERPKPAPVNAPKSNIKVDGSADQQLTTKLMEAIENNNLEGFDYLEFKNTLTSIIHVIEDESTRYRTAFEMAKTMGASKDTLLESINHYVEVLKKEESKFKDALENQKQKQITTREEELKRLQDSVQEKESHIQKLTAEITDTRKKMDEKRAELQHAVDKIENTNAQFNASIQQVNDQLVNDRQNLTKYI
jgi:septal ring factor EnvC (AmiA/AmiB activator)